MCSFPNKDPLVDEDADMGAPKIQNLGCITILSVLQLLGIAYYFSFVFIFVLLYL